MESVDCWSLAIIPVQTLEGRATLVTVIFDVTICLLSLTFAVHVTVAIYVSGVSVANRGGSHVEGIQTRQSDAIQRSQRRGGKESDGFAPERDRLHGQRGQTGDHFHPDLVRSQSCGSKDMGSSLPTSGTERG